MLQISNKVKFFKHGEKDFEKLTFTWMTRPSIIALAIIQKRESQHGDNKKSTPNFPKKRTFLALRYAQVHVRIKR